MAQLLKVDLKSKARVKLLKDVQTVLPNLQTYMAEILPIYSLASLEKKMELRQNNSILDAILSLAGVD
jgi:hypothetical protein